MENSLENSIEGKMIFKLPYYTMAYVYAPDGLYTYFEIRTYTDGRKYMQIDDIAHELTSYTCMLYNSDGNKYKVIDNISNVLIDVTDAIFVCIHNPPNCRAICCISVCYYVIDHETAKIPYDENINALFRNENTILEKDPSILPIMHQITLPENFCDKQQLNIVKIILDQHEDCYYFRLTHSSAAFAFKFLNGQYTPYEWRARQLQLI